MIGKNIRIFSSDEISEDEYKTLWNTIKSEKEWRGTFHNKKKDGSLYWAKESIAPIKDGNNILTHFIVIQEVLQKLKKFPNSLSIKLNMIR